MKWVIYNQKCFLGSRGMIERHHWRHLYQVMKRAIVKHVNAPANNDEFLLLVVLLLIDYMIEMSSVLS